MSVTGYFADSDYHKISRCSGFLPQSKDVQVRLTAHSKLPVGVKVSVNGCLSLRVGPVIDWRPVQFRPQCPQCQLGIVSSLPQQWTVMNGL